MTSWHDNNFNFLLLVLNRIFSVAQYNCCSNGEQYSNLFCTYCIYNNCVVYYVLCCVNFIVSQSLSQHVSQLCFFRVSTTLENMEISGNLLILENSGNLKFTQGIYQIVSLGHRVMCIIVSNSSVHWWGDTVTGVDGASHRAPSIKYCVILQESCRTEC